MIKNKRQHMDGGEIRAIGRFYSEIIPHCHILSPVAIVAMWHSRRSPEPQWGTLFRLSAPACRPSEAPSRLIFHRSWNTPREYFLLIDVGFEVNPAVMLMGHRLGKPYDVGTYSPAIYQCRTVIGHFLRACFFLNSLFGCKHLCRYAPKSPN